MNLLVDIGNSRLKWALSDQGGLAVGIALLNHTLTEGRLAEIWRDLPRPGHLAIACVSARRLAGIVRSAASTLWPGIAVLEAKSEAQAFGVTNAYLQPEKLGVDRWLALLAARRHYTLPVCIVDCGTAITVDLLDESGRHLGGMICPGLELMKKSLSGGTEALGYDDSAFTAGPANHTAAAIYSGVLAAAAGLIEHVFSARSEHCGLLLTGGDASLIAGQLGCASRIDNDLVLRGLSLLLE
ncbi:type III pantothenate kinase [Methylomicrobium sp. Wu6]|uniref:type III pantothenate kinase n=1 Tax=Methylomicrobium sp. Wu6 TaxID=3107928 RepID=UPI002DD65EE0|nr:type III pantothenate kinase [Methylomicrobium sp. Wu6]MEC4750147.1 type III pantothenate kinase [Methylomicrobium sp. Wu6]